jgi:hypothetical protein
MLIAMKLFYTAWIVGIWIAIDSVFGNPGMIHANPGVSISIIVTNPIGAGFLLRAVWRLQS